jgi:hypothetical protein
VPEKLQGVADDLVDRQQCLFGRLPRRHRSNTRYDVGRSSRVGDNGLGQFADVGQIRLGSIEQPQRHLAVDGNSGKRLIDLMGNGSGQLAEH